MFAGIALPLNASVRRQVDDGGSIGVPPRTRLPHGDIMNRSFAINSSGVLLAILMCGSALASVAAVAQTPTSRLDQEQLIADENAWAKAAVDGNADLMASYMANDYVELSWEVAKDKVPAHWSSTTKLDWVNAVRSRTTTYKSVDLRNLTVHLQGRLAVVTGEYSQTTFDGTKDSTISGIYVNTWAKRNGRWLVVHSVFP